MQLKKSETLKWTDKNINMPQNKKLQWAVEYQKTKKAEKHIAQHIKNVLFLQTVQEKTIVISGSVLQMKKHEEREK